MHSCWIKVLISLKKKKEKNVLKLVFIKTKKCQNDE